MKKAISTNFNYINIALSLLFLSLVLKEHVITLFIIEDSLARSLVFIITKK